MAKAQTLTPYLVMKDAHKALAFYKDVFNAREDMHLDGPDGKLMHAQLSIGDSVLMLTEECNQMPGPGKDGSPIALYLMVDDVDAVFKKAVVKGAKAVMEPMDMFYGHRMGNVVDPFGHSWSIATAIENVSEDELKRRSEKMFAEMKK